MRTFTRYFLLIGLLPTLQLSAQTIPRTVISSSGGYYDNLLFGNLHFTVGEIAVAEYQNGIVLGEGFHRTYTDILVRDEDILPADWKVRLYPNPTLGRVRIELPEHDEVHAHLYNASGQLVQSYGQLHHRASIDLTALPAATYIIRLTGNDGQSGSFQLVKINY